MSVVYFDQLLRAALLCIPISSWVLVIRNILLSSCISVSALLQYFKMHKMSRHICSMQLNWLLVKYEEYRIMSMCLINCQPE